MRDFIVELYSRTLSYIQYIIICYRVQRRGRGSTTGPFFILLIFKVQCKFIIDSKTSLADTPSTTVKRMGIWPDIFILILYMNFFSKICKYLLL